MIFSSGIGVTVMKQIDSWESGMKRFLIVVMSFLILVGLVQAGSDCYVVTEDALAADSQITWEIGNSLLKNQEMEKTHEINVRRKNSSNETRGENTDDNTWESPQ